MAFSNDSARQFRRQTIQSPSHAASISDSPVALSIRPRKISDSGQKIIPPQEKDAPRQQAVFLDQADEARTYLKDCLAGLQFPDEPREFILSVSSFYELEEDPDFESDREELQLEYSYNARTSILNLFPMPGKRHACIIQWLHRLVITKLSLLIQTKIDVSPGLNWIFFKGKWRGSKKVPDLGIAWVEDVGGHKLHTVVEVGVSQSRESLLDLRDLYLKGDSDVSRFVFINVITTPKYRSPKDFDVDQLQTIQKADFQLESDQGPLWYKGIQWVGKTTLVWEVWERHLENGEPTQVLQATIDPNNSDTQLPFFEIPTTIATDIDAITINSMDISELWCCLWKHAIIDEAMFRMMSYMENMNRRQKCTADMVEQKDEAAKKETKG